MTGQEMVDQISDAIRNATIDTKIVRWINMKITECGMKFTFEYLQKYAAVNTAVGTPDVVLASDYQWLKSAQIPVQNRFIYPKDESFLSQAYPNYRTQQGQVTYYYMSGPRTLGLFLVPSSIVSLNYCYQARPLKLAGLDLPNEQSDLPEEFHQYICKGAEILAWQYEGDSEQYTQAVIEEKKLLRTLGLTRYRRPDAPLEMGSDISNSRVRPAYPKLPANFPRN